MTELLPAGDDPGATFLPSRDTAGRVWGLAESIARTEFVPGSLRGKPEAIMAAMLTGREIGIGAMHSLRAIDVIDGRPSLSPELLHALALKAGHDVDVEESTREGATVAVHRADWPADRVRRVTFDEVDARLAGLVGPECRPADGQHKEDRTTRSGNPTCACKQGYRTYPRAMYRARAIAEACRTFLPDVTERIGYTAEEFGGDNPDHGEAMAVVTEVAPDRAATIADQHAPDGDEPDDGQPVEDVTPDEDDDGGAESAPARTGEGGVASEEGGTPTPAPAPDPAERAHARTLSAVYGSLKATEVSDLVRNGEVTVDGTTYTATPHDVWQAEQGRDGPFRKTVKGALDAVGYLNRATKDVAEDDDAPEASPSAASAPEADGGGDDTPDATSGDSGPQDTIEVRREALRGYKRHYREALEVHEPAAKEMHAYRLEVLGDADDATFASAPIEKVRDVVEYAARKHAAVVPF